MCQDRFLGDLGNINEVEELGSEEVERVIAEAAASAERKGGYNNVFMPTPFDGADVLLG